MGRPSNFRPEFVEQVRALCKLGATEREVAEFFGAGERTVRDWKGAHPEFAAAMQLGKDEADARVVNALYQRALGGEWGGKTLPPDVVACIFWLKNRQPDLWRDRRDLDVSGKVEHFVAEVPELAKDADEWLKAVKGASSGGQDQPRKLNS